MSLEAVIVAQIFPFEADLVGGSDGLERLSTQGPAADGNDALPGADRIDYVATLHFLKSAFEVTAAAIAIYRLLKQNGSDRKDAEEEVKKQVLAAKPNLPEDIIENLRKIITSVIDMVD